jgi:hypothetical protein
VQFDDGSPIDGDPESLADDSPASGRYVFVTARFDSALIPPPELEDVPEASAPASQPDSEAAPSSEDAARAAIIASNERKQKEYDEKVAAGQERVRELNKRFADWYFVVSYDTYQKIRLRRKNIVSRPEAPATQPLSPANPIPMSVPPPTPES